MVLKKYFYTIIVSCILLLTFFVYKPGLFGGFMFDDFVNLVNINFFAQSEGIDAFVRYIISYESIPLKRPISTLSFLLNATHWPANAFSFKFLNLIIHLLNGLLLYFVSKKILNLLDVAKNKIKLAAALNMTIWILHPFFVSTTLYVVQRMAMLPVTFILIGIYVYLLARESQLHENKNGLKYLFLSIYICTGLAVLSKENGIVLPFLLYILEVIVISKSQIPSLIKKYQILLILPIVLILLALILKIPSFIEGYSQREFSLGERLLTQPRMLVTYIYHLFIPQYFTEGIFVDGIVTSTSLFKPIATLFSILLLVSTIVFAFYYRNKYVVISFSILFFLISHVMESTFIPLEMYFEHRNYLPALFIFLPFSIFLANHFIKYKINFILMLILILYLANTTYLRSQLWSNNDTMVVQSVERFPQSVRLIDQYVTFQYSQGNTNDAIETLEISLLKHKDILLRLNLINLKCSINQTNQIDFDNVINYIHKVKITSEDISSIAGILRILIKGECVKNNYEVALNLIDAFKANRGYQNKKVSIVVDFHEAYIYLSLKEHDKALKLFEDYFINYLTFDDTIYVIGIFIENKQYKKAYKLLILLEKQYLTRNNFLYKKDYSKDIKLLKIKIEKK